VVPPLIGMVPASGRVKAGGDPFELLIEDHRQILSVSEQLSQAPQDSKMQRSRLFLALKRKLAKHAMAEEDVVYPIVHGQARESDESKQRYDGHEVAALTDLIRSHAAEEEQVVFPMLRRQMEQSRLPAMSGQISREEALVV
jgi:hemerythrin superfamily protein